MGLYRYVKKESLFWRKYINIKSNSRVVHRLLLLTWSSSSQRNSSLLYINVLVNTIPFYWKYNIENWLLSSVFIGLFRAHSFTWAVYIFRILCRSILLASSGGMMLDVCLCATWAVITASSTCKPLEIGCSIRVQTI